MKKMYLIFGVLTVMALTSCRKDWTCKCTDNAANTTYYTVPDASFNDADVTCNGNEYHTSATIYNNCSLVP